MPVLRSKPKQKAEYTAFITSQRRSKPAPETDRRFSDSSATSSNSNNPRPVADDMACGIDNLENLATNTAAYDSDETIDLEIRSATTSKKTTTTTTTKKVTNTRAISIEGVEARPDDDDTIIEDTDEDTTPPPYIEIEFDKPERGTDLTSHPPRPFDLFIDPTRALPTPPSSNSSRTPSPAPNSGPKRSQLRAQERAEKRLRANLPKKHRQMAIFSWCGQPRDKNGKVKGEPVWLDSSVLDANVGHKFVDNRERGCITEAERDEDREKLRAAGIVIEGL